MGHMISPAEIEGLTEARECRFNEMQRRSYHVICSSLAYAAHLPVDLLELAKQSST